MSSYKAYLESMPKKRMGAGCLFFNEAGDVMLVKPTYKPYWEIPGGAVELNESPKQGCQREVREELGLERVVGDLLVVDYNFQVDKKTESLMFIFNGGIISENELSAIQLSETELSEYRFFSKGTLPNELTDPLRNRILAAWDNAIKGICSYLEEQKTV